MVANERDILTSTNNSLWDTPNVPMSQDSNIMNEKQFMTDLWDVLRGNTDYITLEQFKNKYDSLFVECDNDIKLADDHNEWHLSLRKTWTDEFSTKASLVCRRERAKNGKVYRIRRTVSAYDIWEIEYMRKYSFPSGQECDAWFAAFEPKQKLFTNWEEVNEVFNKLIEEENV